MDTREAGSLGGKKAANNMTSEQRTARAKKASEAAKQKRLSTVPKKNSPLPTTKDV